MKKLRSFTIMTVSLLTLNAVEEVMIYKLNRVVRNEYTLTFILLLMFGAGFVIVAGLFVPWLRDVFQHLHSKSKRKGGHAGLLLMYAGMFALFFFIYHVIYIEGPQFLLPRAWR